MNKKKIIAYFFLAGIFLFVGIYYFITVTGNFRARFWGGTMDVKLPPNHTVLNATWKESSLWVISKDTITGEVVFWESSSWGLAEGTVRFK